MAPSGLILSQLFSAVMGEISRIRAFFDQSQSLHTARFARLHELTSLVTHTFDEPSLLLGSSSFNQVLSVRPTQTRRELGNTLIVAPPRSGKSVLATAQLLSWPHSVIVNDVKGELFAATAGYRASVGKVFVIDPTGIGHCYDPLLGKHTEDELLSAATHLLYESDEREKIFTQRAIVMLVQVFLAARIEGQPPLPYVRQMIRLGLPAVAQRLHALDPKLASQLLDVPSDEADFTDRFLLSSWSTLTSRMIPLLTETVVKSLTCSDFMPRDLLYSPKPISIFLRWKEQHLLALSPLVRLMVSSLIDGLITTYDSAKGVGCHPVLLLIDEAGRQAIPSLAEHASTVVGRGITLWIAIQSLAQLNVVYGRERATILRDCMESQIYYRPNDLGTAEYLERCLGRRSDYAHSQTLREGEETSEGRSEQGIPLLTAWEIKQLRDDDVLIFHRLLAPIRAKRMDWRRHPLLAQRHNLPVPPVPSLPALSGLPLRSDPAYELVDPDSLH
jgi:type IV secretion system protein VirD4